MNLFFIVLLISVEMGIARDFLSSEGEQAFLNTLKQLAKDREEALSWKQGSLEKNKPLEDESVWHWSSLSKRSITSIKPNKIRLNLPDSLPKENGTGRVEVYHNNQWGTVCDKSWDHNDAFVVCNELGLVKAIHETKNAKYGQGEGPVWLSKVDCSGGESSLSNCPHPGWGNVGSCTHGNDAGVKCLNTGIPRLIEVGCYKDSESNRALRTLFGFLRSEIDWNNLRNMVTKCAERAWKRRFSRVDKLVCSLSKNLYLGTLSYVDEDYRFLRYFGIQFYGECWSDIEAETRYAMHGEVDKKDQKQNCIEGNGMHWANFIYKFAPWRDLGCWKDDTRDRAVPHLLVNLRSQIDWFNIGKTIDKCYQAAKNAGKDYFAVQFYGECWVADDDSTYMKHGPSVACWSGVGKGLTNYVYKVEW